MRYDVDLEQLRNDNRNLQTKLNALQAENNTLRVQLQAAFSVISHLEQRPKLQLKSLSEEVLPIRQKPRYEILKDDLEGNPCRIESVDGLEQATNRIEELAASDPSSEYYLYCVQADKLIRHLHRTSPRSNVLPSEALKKKAG